MTSVTEDLDSAQGYGINRLQGQMGQSVVDRASKAGSRARAIMTGFVLGYGCEDWAVVVLSRGHEKVVDEKVVAKSGRTELVGGIEVVADRGSVLKKGKEDPWS